MRIEAASIRSNAPPPSSNGWPKKFAASTSPSCELRRVRTRAGTTGRSGGSTGGEGGSSHDGTTVVAPSCGGGGCGCCCGGGCSTTTLSRAGGGCRAELVAAIVGPVTSAFVDEDIGRCSGSRADLGVSSRLRTSFCSCCSRWRSNREIARRGLDGGGVGRSASARGVIGGVACSEDDTNALSTGCALARSCRITATCT